MLHVPVGANTFGVTLPSWGTTRPGNSMATSVTPGSGTKGSWVQLGSDLTEDCHGILVNISSNSASAASRNTVVDIGTDESGGTSYSVVIPDLLAGGAVTYTTGGSGLWFFFPLFIPAGAAVAARAAGSVTTAIRVGVTIMQRPYNPSMIRKGSFVEALGITGQAGVSITPGTTSEGAWASIGTTAHRCWWWQAAIQVPTTDTAWNANTFHVDVAVGNGSEYDIIIQDLVLTTTTAEAMVNLSRTAGAERDVPAGSTIYVRAQASGTLNTYTAAVYGLGG